MDNSLKISTIELVRKKLPIVEASPEPKKSRGYVGLAYEYFNANMEKEAFEMIEKATPEYYQKQMFEDIINVKGFDMVVFTIMSKLHDLGYIKEEENL